MYIISMVTCYMYYSSFYCVYLSVVGREPAVWVSVADFGTVLYLAGENVEEVDPTYMYRVSNNT